MTWNNLLNQTLKRFAVLQKETPASFAGFEMMGKAAKASGALDEKTKEFIALGIAISTRCESCIGFHTKSLLRLGATREEFVKLWQCAPIWVAVPQSVLVQKHLKFLTNFPASSQQLMRLSPLLGLS